jgi:hypothetical protein
MLVQKAWNFHATITSRILKINVSGKKAMGTSAMLMRPLTVKKKKFF